MLQNESLPPNTSSSMQVTFARSSLDRRQCPEVVGQGRSLFAPLSAVTIESVSVSPPA